MHHCLTVSRIVPLIVLLSLPCKAQENIALTHISPKLKTFLTDHPAASKALSSELFLAFGSRLLTIYYFYTDDKSSPSAEHYYPKATSVVITVKENQQPSDECICLLFEMINSEGEPRFQQLSAMARAGTISRETYATEILRQEFVALKKMRSLIPTFQMNSNEIKESDYYGTIMSCPDDFTQFLIYRLKVNPNRDSLLEYEHWYDSLHPKPQPN